MNFSELEILYRILPRKSVGFYPTPFHKLANLSRIHGINLFMKREDLAGPGAISGSKMRVAELIIGQALKDGASYLVWVGVRLLWKPRLKLERNDPEVRNRIVGGAFWRGLLTNLLNPKVGVFYVTFLPQFIPSGVSVAGYSFFLASLHVLLTMIWFGVLIAATAPLSAFLRRPGAVKALDRLTGCLFIGFGVKLATSSSH